MLCVHSHRKLGSCGAARAGLPGLWFGLPAGAEGAFRQSPLEKTKDFEPPKPPTTSRSHVHGPSVVLKIYADNLNLMRA